MRTLVISSMLFAANLLMAQESSDGRVCEAPHPNCGTCPALLKDTPIQELADIFELTSEEFLRYGELDCEFGDATVLPKGTIVPIGQIGFRALNWQTN